MTWQSRAACRGMRIDLFFPKRGEPNWQARNVCHGCPVQRQCLELALSDPDTRGIWAGTTERERDAIRALRVRRRRAA